MAEHGQGDRTATQRSVTVLIAMMVFTLASTTVHYSHNFVAAQDYPPVPLFFPNALAYRIGIAVFWPLLTVVGYRGYVLYRRGQWRDAALALFAYSMLGFTTIFHYTGGVPRVPAFFTVTIFTDFVSGSLLLGFSGWVLLADQKLRRSAPGTPSPGSDR